MKIFLIILAVFFGVLLLLALLLCVRVWVSVAYDEEPIVKIKALFFSYKILPKKKKWRMKKHLPKAKKASEASSKAAKKAAKKSAKKAEKRAAKKASSKAKPKKSLSEQLTFYKELATKVAIPTAKRLQRHLALRIYSLKVFVGGGDASKTAISYGIASSAAETLFGFFSSCCDLKAVKKKNVFIAADFSAASTAAEIDIAIGLRLWQALHILLPAVISFVKVRDDAEYRHMINQIKEKRKLDEKRKQNDI